MVLISLLLTGSLLSKAQIGYGIYGGLSINLGNKLTRVGLTGGGYANYNYVQLNLKAGGFYNFKSIGVGAKTLEGMFGAGILGTYGARDSTKVMFNTSIDNNTYRKNSLGYAWHYYWDTQGTSQATGIFVAGYDKITVSTENDLFGWLRGKEDKYRTGAIRISYQYENWDLAWKHILYTGDLDEKNKKEHPNYPARFGYYGLEDAKHSAKSHGISALEVRYKLPYEQVASFSLGVDSEWVRFIAQDWLIHDGYYMPVKWVKHPNYHIPMVAIDGSQYLFTEEQKVKPTTIYFDLGLNTPMFY